MWQKQVVSGLTAFLFMPLIAKLNNYTALTFSEQIRLKMVEIQGEDMDRPPRPV